MKRLVLLFGLIIMATSSSQAYVYENETSDVNVLEKQGFSQGTLEIIDKVNETNKGIYSKYKRAYTKKEHKNIGKVYDEIKVYFDPMQDDGKFGEHPINYSNTWQGDNTHYSNELIKTENL